MTRKLERTETGDGHFLAYILLRWYSRPSLLRVGVHAHCPPLFTLTTPSTQVMSPPSTPSPARLAICSYLYPNQSPLLPFSLVWPATAQYCMWGWQINVAYFSCPARSPSLRGRRAAINTRYARMPQLHACHTRTEGIARAKTTRYKVWYYNIWPCGLKN